MKDNLKGKVLIAHPKLEDSNFNGSVVLIVEHDSDGAMGFVLNRSIGLLEKKEKESIFVFEGGPVAQDSFWILASKKKNNFKKIKTGLFYGEGSSYTKLKIKSSLEGGQNIRCFVGCASWVKNQLEEEVHSEVWIVADIEPKEVFNLDGVEMWVRTISKNNSDFKWTKSFIGDPDKN